MSVLNIVVAIDESCKLSDTSLLFSDLPCLIQEMVVNAWCHALPTAASNCGTFQGQLLMRCAH